eukprot:386046-Hanusia_phi.AAC.1
MITRPSAGPGITVSRRARRYGRGSVRWSPAAGAMIESDHRRIVAAGSSPARGPYSGPNFGSTAGASENPARYPGAAFGQ